MFDDFVSMVFPEYCLMCEEPLARQESNICIHCKYNLPKTMSHLASDYPLIKRFWGKIPLKHAWAYLKFTKQGKVQKALHKLKYG